MAFDEATSSVDQLTENALIRDVVKENKVSTILSITHKLPWQGILISCDVNGSVVALGLMKRWLQSQISSLISSSITFNSNKEKLG